MTLEVSDDVLKDRLAHLGGDLDDIDSEEFDNVDRGDSLDAPAMGEEEEPETPADNEGDQADENSDEGSDKGADDEGADTEENEPDPSETDDTDDEEETSDEDDDDRSGKAGKQAIPKWRFDEVNRRMRAAEERLKQLESEQKAADDAADEAYDFDEAEREYAELVTEGRVEEALAKRREIRAAERAEFEESAVRKSTQQTEQKAVSAEINSLAKQAEEMYPIFSADHEDFDPAVSDRVLVFYEGYLRHPTEDIKSPSDAFVAAIADVIQLYDLDARYNKKPDPEPAPEKKPAAISKTKDKLELAKKQPTPAATGGKSSADAGADVIDVNKLSDDELAALPEATLARLRGDFI